MVSQNIYEEIEFVCECCGKKVKRIKRKDSNYDYLFFFLFMYL